MSYTIDLKELSIRESEKVEWKENGDDKDVIKSIVKTISAFANDIANVGGGYVVCGAKEIKETIEARNGILSQLLNVKQEIEPFDRRANANVDEADIDSLLFRDCMIEMNLVQPDKPLERYFSDREQIAEFVPPLCVKKSLDGKLCLRNFALFMFGKKKSISLNFPDVYIALSIYNGTDRSESTAERHLLTGSIIEQAKKAIELLNTQAYTAFDKMSDKPNQVKYPVRALQEALINAVVHRDYEISEPVRVTVFSDRIEIYSPGRLHWGVDKEKFLAGKASAKWRNQSFAYLFNKLQLAQSEGQGIPTIIRTMKEEGCPAPIFETGADSVTCILPAHPRHRIIREIQTIQDKIILGKLDEAKEQVLKLLNTDLYNYRTLDLYCEIVGKQKNIRELYDFLIHKKIDYTMVNSNTLLTMVEMLTAGGDAHYQKLAEHIVSCAVNSPMKQKRI
ncbi:MAG: putative DNA binding domain-containing protein [Tannerellaceae bacterium]|nr:putative DNA binding domain-containing protein [Tannerellaceae bacterium]